MAPLPTSLASKLPSDRWNGGGGGISSSGGGGGGGGGDTHKQTSVFRNALRKAAPIHVRTDKKRSDDHDHPVSPTSAAPQLPIGVSPMSPSHVSPHETRMNDFGAYRSDLSAIETNRRIPEIQHNPPTASSPAPNAVAPWMATTTAMRPMPPASNRSANFFEDAGDGFSQVTQLSPAFRPGTAVTGNTVMSDALLDRYQGGEERRPSVASVTTASSVGSRTSNRGGIHKKLQNFFGEDFAGRDVSDSSLPTTGRRDRSNSFVRGRERNMSFATDTTGSRRQSSPVDVSRPRTPIPSSEVTPWNYQDLRDVQHLGEAPVRAELAGPDRERYMGEGYSHSSTNMSKPTTHTHPLRPSLSRGESATSVKNPINNSSGALSCTPDASSLSLPKRATSPAPSFSASITSATQKSKVIDPSSPEAHAKRNFLGRFRRNKDKDTTPNRLKDLPGSVRSHLAGDSSPSNTTASPEFGQWMRSREGSITSTDMNSPNAGYTNRPSTSRQGTFPKLAFRKGRHKLSEDNGVAAGGPDQENAASGAVFSLDTNLSNMEGILSTRAPLTPSESNMYAATEDGSLLDTADADGLAWNAPDSWAVKKITNENASNLLDEGATEKSTMVEELAPSYFIRIFRADNTFVTLSIALNATITDFIAQMARKTYVAENLDKYQIVMKKRDLERVLTANERPVAIQKRLLEQAGYEERDRIEDIGRDDNSYLCRFSFVPARQNAFTGISAEMSKIQKYNHVNLSGMNLITIPISLYSRATEIVSLNLSRNLSLDLPKDFIQGCTNLRDIKYISNEALKLPVSISRASRLTILDVSNNRLEQLEHAELSRLQNLASLKLANNQLKSLPIYFGDFKFMRTLNISSNFLDAFPEFLCNLEALVDLDLSFNNIAELPDSINKLQNLERFVMTNNLLTESVPKTFSELIQLKEVDIRYNALSSIDIIAKLPQVEQIFADHNAVSVCETEFTKIRILRLNSNPVTKFEILNLVPSLTTLNLSNAKLAQIPDASFEKMPNLVKLVLDRNHFVALPAHIGKLKKLEHFSIARNALNSIPSEMGCLTELRFLDVRENNLKKIPPEIWYASKLEHLNISSNVLDQFPKPASRPPPVPGESSLTSHLPNGSLAAESIEELGPLESFRRPSQASTGLLSVGSSPVPSDRKSSVVSVYGKGGRKTSVVSRSTSASTVASNALSHSIRKDSSVSAKLYTTFAGSLRNLYLADNELDNEVFDEITLLSELRVLNLSYNEISDMPQNTLKRWPNLVELYLSGNELTSLPSDDFEEFSLLQVLHLNGNKFQTLPAELGKAHRLAVLDCGSNSLKYNVSNWPYDWNWNWNTNLKYLNLSGNKRLEIKPSLPGGSGSRDGRDLTDFSALQHLRILGLMDVTLTISTVPDQTEDRRVRTSGSLAGQLAYGMADTLGKNDHLSIIDMVVPRFNATETETLLGMFDGQVLPGGGSKIAQYLHENFGHTFNEELRKLNLDMNETPVDALRRSFLSLNKELATAALHYTEERSILSHRGSAAPAVLSPADLNSGGVATVMFLQQSELYVANVGDAQAMLIQAEGSHRMLTRKHDPAEPSERQRIRDAGGWVSRQGKLNDVLEVSRAFGYVQLMPAVQAAPYICQVSIKEQDEMILIASRELWEYLSPKLVTDIARYEREDLMRAAQRLRDLAIAFGASNKLMVMMIGVSDLKKRAQIRPHRVQSLSINPSMMVDDGYQPTRRTRKKAETVEDSGLRRLKAEVAAPVGDVSIVFTDIKDSTLLWETYPNAMRSAIKLHNEVMRRQLRIIGGYEVKTEGDAFMVSFPTATSALLWTFAVQSQLLEIPWPSEVLTSSLGQEIFDHDNNLIYKGLRVRMGIHWGQPVCENDPVTRRMDYFGPMVNRTSRISGVADGGQITVSSDFISEIHRCLETYTDHDRNNSTASDDTFESDALAQLIRRELRSLSTQGFEVKDLGERKLKGLENPEYIYLMYPHTLSGRIHYQERMAENEKSIVSRDPASLEQQSQLQIDTDTVFALWGVSLRLEMLCSSLEEGHKGHSVALQPPETQLLERVKQTGGEVTDRFLLNFLTHQVSRIETCISTLCTRHLAIGKCDLTSLAPLSGSMDDILGGLSQQLEELRRYKELYGELPST